MPRKLARKSDKQEQSKRFIDAAREAGASEDEAVFNENLKRLAQHKPREERKADGDS